MLTSGSSPALLTSARVGKAPSPPRVEALILPLASARPPVSPACPVWAGSAPLGPHLLAAARCSWRGASQARPASLLTGAPAAWPTPRQQHPPAARLPERSARRAEVPAAAVCGTGCRGRNGVQPHRLAGSKPGISMPVQAHRAPEGDGEGVPCTLSRGQPGCKAVDGPAPARLSACWAPDLRCKAPSRMIHAAWRGSPAGPPPLCETRPRVRRSGTAGAPGHADPAPPSWQRCPTPAAGTRQGLPGLQSRQRAAARAQSSVELSTSCDVRHSQPELPGWKLAAEPPAQLTVQIIVSGWPLPAPGAWINPGPALSISRAQQLGSGSSPGGPRDLARRSLLAMNHMQARAATSSRNNVEHTATEMIVVRLAGCRRSLAWQDARDWWGQLSCMDTVQVQFW